MSYGTGDYGDGPYGRDATVREVIAAAANDVDDVSVTPYYRQSLRPGEGMVRLAGVTRDGSGVGFIDTWQVWIALNQDNAAAEEWLDEHRDALTDTFADVLVVESITPAQLALGGTNPVNGVVIQGARETN